LEKPQAETSPAAGTAVEETPSAGVPVAAPQEAPTPCCKILGIEVKVGGETKGAGETKKWADKLKEKLKDKEEGAEQIGEQGAAIIKAYEFILTLTRPWDIYAKLGKGTCKGKECQIDEKKTEECRVIPRSKAGQKNGMPGGVGGSENEAWPPNTGANAEWWKDVGTDALARALANILKYCECDDGKYIWPPADAKPVAGCK
jgi:hypothetical protein